MGQQNRDVKKISLPKKAILSKSKRVGEGELANMMNDPRYLRQSAAVINEALQKGFDVLQLANGDIVMTGIKTIVYHYTWNDDQAKLVKTKPEAAPKKGRKLMVEEDEDFDEEGA